MSEECPLTDLPDHILEKIIANVNLKDRVSVRKSCKTLRWFTDKRRTHYYLVFISLRASKITIVFREGSSEGEFLEVDYFPHAEGCLVKTPEKETLVANENFVDVALLDLKVYLVNPRVTIKDLIFSRRGDLVTSEDLKSRKMKTLLESLNHQLCVKELEIHHGQSEDVMCVLPYLKPGHLDYLHLSHSWNENWKSIVETDQWAQTKGLMIDKPGVPAENFLPFRNALFHCETFSVEQLKMFIEAASQPPFSLYFLRILGLQSTPGIADYLRDFPNLDANHRYKDQNLHHIKIPNSIWHVKIQFNHETYIEIGTVRDATLVIPNSENHQF